MSTRPAVGHAVRMLLRLLLVKPLAAFAQGSLVADWQKKHDTWYWKAPVDVKRSYDFRDALGSTLPL